MLRRFLRYIARFNLGERCEHFILDQVVGTAEQVSAIEWVKLFAPFIGSGTNVKSTTFKLMKSASKAQEGVLRCFLDNLRTGTIEFSCNKCSL